MKVFICKICGDPYLGEAKPTNCPFCGAHSKYIVLAGDYEEPAIEKLTEVSKRNLERALELEVDNTQFYACASKIADSLEGKAMYKALSKIESEHASTISKALKIKKPAIDLNADVCFSSHSENLRDSFRREKRAVKFYSKFFREAEEPRVKEIFEALIQIEGDHITLLRNMGVNQ